MNVKALPTAYPEIYETLYSLGITATYAGFFHTSYAVYLAVQQPERLLLATKWIYPDVAKQYQTDWRNVERNIRTVAAVAWKCHPDLLSDIARCGLVRRPSGSQFIAILAFHVLLLSKEARTQPIPPISA